MQKKELSLNDESTQVLRFAAEEARLLQHNYIGTEHLLLGLLRGPGAAAEAMTAAGATPEALRDTVERLVGRGEGPVEGDMGYTPRAAHAAKSAEKEARRLGQSAVAPEHLLLAMLRARRGIGIGALSSAGVDVEALRARLDEVNGTATPRSTRDNVVMCRLGDADLDAIDMLVEAGVRSSRSDAAAWLIAAGIQARRDTITNIQGTVAEIRRLRDVARQLALDTSDDREP